MSDRTIDPLDFRHALGTFATGVTVVTTIQGDGQPRGFTANSFTSVSLEPPLVLVCIAKTAGSFEVFANSTGFAINVLAESQRDVSAAFASPAGKRFEAVSCGAGSTGSPLIEGVVSWFDCRMHDTVDAGDHVILIGRVVDYQHGPEMPLGYCRGSYVSFGLSQQAIQAAGGASPSKVAAVVEHNGAMMIYRDPATGAFEGLPYASHYGSASDKSSLLGKLSAAGVAADLSFLYSVYEDADTGMQHIVYRGLARSVSEEAQACFTPFDDMPWDTITDGAVLSMLQRYVRERREDVFGVYVGDVKSGQVSVMGQEVAGDPYGWS